MFKLRILSVGKPTDALLAPAIEEYQRRLARHASLQWEFLPSGTTEAESIQLIDRCGDARVILLDERGKPISSPEIAQSIETAQNHSGRELVIVIGGAHGVTTQMRHRADAIWSFGAITLPHQIVRLVLVEQLYRAYDILSGGPYHHG
jgi:23S rRNA (pseudouridine1915-N3)-methyltransferase